MHWLNIISQMAAVAFGFLAAAYWYKSSKIHPLNPRSNPKLHITTNSGAKFNNSQNVDNIDLRAMDRGFTEIGRLNARAAQFTLASVICQFIAMIFQLFFYYPSS
jgi:hypothetical protein